MSGEIQYIPFLQECSNCKNRKDPQFVFNSTILTIFIVALSFLVSFALNQALKETFEEMFPKSSELSAKWNYAVITTFSVIIIVFLLLYFLNGQKH